ncbi:MAG: DUF5615 family PIN-like protein [Chloroflexota bacterium]|jgi:predicted nuclease of predicted toxin-antitoxin system|nr:DUF5615 family PIN-like protein [Chloroflexota bacterium]
MKIVIDMNFSPSWVPVLIGQGWTAIHWTSIGPPNASDITIMAWAKQNNHVVFTHDLDFGTLLALTHASGPSVIQIRSLNVMPESLQELVERVIRQFETELNSGALITIDERRQKVRVLPI